MPNSNAIRFIGALMETVLMETALSICLILTNKGNNFIL